MVNEGIRIVLNNAIEVTRSDSETCVLCDILLEKVNAGFWRPTEENPCSRNFDKIHKSQGNFYLFLELIKVLQNFKYVSW